MSLTKDIKGISIIFYYNLFYYMIKSRFKSKTEIEKQTNVSCTVTFESLATNYDSGISYTKLNNNINTGY